MSMQLDPATQDKLREEVEREIAENKLFFYGKGSKEIPMCGFTIETIQFLQQFGYPFTVVDVLHNMEKRAVLAEMTNWPTLPKVFLNGKFYGDTDILGPMAESGEWQKLLAEAFPEGPQQA